MEMIEKIAEKQGFKGKKEVEIVNGDLCYVVKSFKKD